MFLKRCKEGKTLDQDAKRMLEKIEASSHISATEIYDVARSIQHENLTDENVIRPLVRQLANLANKPLTREMEDKIVHSVLQKEIPSSMRGLNRFIE